MNQTQPFSYEEFKEIYSQVPRLTVEVVVMDQNQILLTKRSHESWQNQWHIPGGTVLYGETLEAAVKRIAHEELDLSVQVVDMLGYIEYPSEEKERGFGWSIGLAFLCKTRQSIPEQSQQGEEACLFSMLPQQMVKEQKTFLKKVLRESLG